MRVEAMRCADFGPLFFRRRLFLSLGGFNETGTVRGEPGSVRVDCEVQARMAVRGYATLFVDLSTRWTHSEERRAWGHPRMEEGHAWRMRDYLDRFEQEDSPARRQIEAVARAANGRLHCQPPDQVAQIRQTGFMTMPLLPK